MVGNEKPKTHSLATAVATAHSSATASAESFAKKAVQFNVTAEASGDDWGHGAADEEGVALGHACVTADEVRSSLGLGKVQEHYHGDISCHFDSL